MMLDLNNKEILFITDIHQNIDVIKKMNFSFFDIILCGGDILDPSNPDLHIAKKIIDILPENTIIVPGNCDKNNELIEYMKKKLKFIHGQKIQESNIPILGIGYSRSLKDDMKIYRAFFQEDQNRIHDFIKNNNLSFIVKFCGIRIIEDEIKILPEKDAYSDAKDFINKFKSFQESDIAKIFNKTNSLEGGILLTHSPPYSKLDKLNGLPNIGSKEILNGIQKTNPDVVLCGHFHELYGETKINNSIIFNPGAIKDNKYGIIKEKNKKIHLEFKTI